MSAETQYLFYILWACLLGSLLQIVLQWQRITLAEAVQRVQTAEMGGSLQASPVQSMLPFRYDGKSVTKPVSAATLVGDLADRDFAVVCLVDGPGRQRWVCTSCSSGRDCVHVQTVIRVNEDNILGLGPLVEPSAELIAALDARIHKAKGGATSISQVHKWVACWCQRLIKPIAWCTCTKIKARQAVQFMYI